MDQGFNMRILGVLLLLLVISCSTIKVCFSENECATYRSIGKDVGHLQVEMSVKGKKFKAEAGDVKSSKALESIAKGAIKGLKL